MSTAQDSNTSAAASDARAKLSSSLNQAQATAANVTEQIKAHPAVQQASQSFSQYIGQLDKELTRYPVMVQLEEKTQVPKAYGALGACAVFLSAIFINSLALPVSNLVGWALPAYLSYRALESPGHEDDIQWLTYWTVFGFFTFLESVALRLVLYYVPYYFPIKTAFVLWLQLPNTKGAQAFHHSVIKPIVHNVRSRRAAYNPNTSTSSAFDTSAYQTTSTTYGDGNKSM